MLKLREAQRLEPILRTGQEPYRYEREVEEFLRYSPSVRRRAERESGPPADAP